MGRTKAFEDIEFLRAIPEGLDNAVTAHDIALKMGCSYSLVAKQIKRLHDAGEVFMGRSGKGGRFTYYVPQKQPELMLPMIKDLHGVSRTLMFWLELAKPENADQAFKKLGKLGQNLIFPIVVQYALHALKLNETQSLDDVRIAAQIHHNKIDQAIKAYQAISDSIRHDYVLEGESGILEDMEATIRVMFNDLDLTDEDLVTMGDTWRLAR